MLRIRFVSSGRQHCRVIRCEYGSHIIVLLRSSILLACVFAWIWWLLIELLVFISQRSTLKMVWSFLTILTVDNRVPYFYRHCIWCSRLNVSLGVADAATRKPSQSCVSGIEYEIKTCSWIWSKQSCRHNVMACWDVTASPFLFRVVVSRCGFDEDIKGDSRDMLRCCYGRKQGEWMRGVQAAVTKLGSSTMSSVCWSIGSYWNDPVRVCIISTGRCPYF